MIAFRVLSHRRGVRRLEGNRFSLTKEGEFCQMILDDCQEVVTDAPL